MSASILRLPTAATSYLRVRRYGRLWCIQLVTPREGGRPIATKLGHHPSRTAAIEYAQLTGRRMLRPVRLPGERAP
jgi:hypothetical protein